MYDFHIQFYRVSADMSLELYFLLEIEGSPKPLGNPKWKKGHNFPLFIGSMADGGRARFLHWAGKFGSQLDDLGAFFFGFSISKSPLSRGFRNKREFG